MKSLSLLLLLVLQTCALGAQRVSLAWYASPDITVTGYVLYVGTNGPGKYTQVINLGAPLARYETNAPGPPPPATTNANLTVTAADSIYTNGVPFEYPHGPSVSCTNGTCPEYGVVYADLQPGVTYYMMVTATDGITESDGSNELSFTVPGGPEPVIQTPTLRKY